LDAAAPNDFFNGPVRPGQRVLALPDHEIPVQYRDSYLACISSGWKRSRRELYLMPLRNDCERVFWGHISTFNN
jgi:hypothetical protein